jgi:hypothetical protein
MFQSLRMYCLRSPVLTILILSWLAASCLPSTSASAPSSALTSILTYTLPPNPKSIKTLTPVTVATFTSTAIQAMTSTATPAMTLTLIPLVSIDLSTLLIQSGDLPEGYSAGKLEENTSQMFQDLPKPDQLVGQQMNYADKQYGEVFVFIYSSPDDLQKAYETLFSDLKANSMTLVGIGQSGFYVMQTLTVSGVQQTSVEIVFSDCKVLVDVLFGSIDLQSASSYAKNLDQRLNPILCQYVH